MDRPARARPDRLPGGAARERARSGGRAARRPRLSPRVCARHALLARRLGLQPRRVRECDREPLPDPRDRSDRAARCGRRRAALRALRATLDSPLGPLSFTCTHLHWKFRHGEVRERQVQAVCDLVLRRRLRGGFPSILVGDFNAEPESAEIRFVIGPAVARRPQRRVPRRLAHGRHGLRDHLVEPEPLRARQPRARPPHRLRLHRLPDAQRRGTAAATAAWSATTRRTASGRQITLVCMRSCARSRSRRTPEEEDPAS